MDDGIPTLEVGFAIDTGGSFEELVQLQKEMDTAEYKAVQSAKNIERATSGMLDLGSARASITAFGSAVTKEAQNSARELARVEKAGEALSRQLDRQAATFGKTREEIRATKVETAALAAEQQGLTELAARLRAQEADLFAAELAAARQARFEAEAASEAKQLAAQQAAAASEAEAEAVRRAADAYRLFEAVAKQKSAAYRESQVAAAAEVRETDNLAAAAARLRASIDPTVAAQQRFDAEIAEARTLIAAGAIGLDDYAAKLRMERTALAEATDAHARGAASAGAHRAAMQGLSFQAQDAFTQISMGANVLSVLAIQGGQAAGQMANMEGRLGKVASFMIGPWGLAITGGLLVLGALTDGLFKSGDASDDLGARQAALAADLDRTTGKIKEQVTWLSILANSRDAEAKLDAGAKAYQTARQRLTTSGRLAGVSFLPDQTVDSVSASGRAFINDQLNRYTGDYRTGLTAEQLVRNLNKQAAQDPTMKGAVKELERYAFAVNDASENNRGLQLQIARTAVAMGTANAEQRKLVSTSTEAAGSASQLIDRQVALATATTPLERARAQLALVQQRGAAADRAGGAALEQYRKDLTDASSAVHSAEAAEKSRSAAERAARRDAAAARKEQNHADELAREAAALEAQVKNLYGLADAYKLSGGAALVAEARVKAESKAIKERGEIDAEVGRQVRLAIAQRVSEGERSTAGMRDQAAAQERVNQMVAAGLIPAERASEYLKNQIADLPLLAAIEAAQQQGLATEAGRATKALADQRAERERLAKAERTGQFSAAMASGADRVAELREELRLVGETDAVRTHALATMRATIEAKRMTDDPAEQQKYIAQQVEIADLEAQRQLRAEVFNNSLRYQADLLAEISDNVTEAAQGLADAFGEGGRALGDLTARMATYLADQERLRAAHDLEIKKLKEIGDAEAERRENALFNTRNATAQIDMFGDMASAAKGFFAEGSKGYAALSAAEKTFRAIQFALSVRAMIQDAAETASSIAKSGLRAAASAVEAVAKAIASLPFPANLVAGAATAAALASIGLSVVRSFSGGGTKPTPANTGTGTVFGDPNAQSASLKNAIDALKEVDTLTNNYAREMSSSLKSIDSQIASFTAVILRTGDINASAGVTEGFKMDSTGGLLKGIITGGGILTKIPIIGGIIGGIGSLIGSLFGSSTKVTASGLYGNSQSLGSILSGGFDASYYSDITKTKKFLGITTGHSYSTQYSSADPALEGQFTLILRSFSDAIKSAAGPLGEATSTIEARLNSFVVTIGKIDLQGLTGDQIQEKLTAIFGAAADGMANAAFPGIAQFQKVGEGAFETLVRVASTVEQVSASLDLLGRNATNLSIAAKLGLADQFESVSAMADAVNSYFEDYYSKEEQAAAKTAQLGSVFASLGLTMPSTLAAFRALVEAQDLTTAAGQATYATLLQLAPAFADLQSALTGAKSAADILSERQDLERQLLELQGNTEAIRQLDLAKLDESNRALQLQIWGLQDAQKAAEAADQLRQAWQSVGDSIMEEVKRIRGLSDATGATSFATLMGQFNAATAMARSNDPGAQDAAKSLPQLSQALLTAALASARSAQEYERVKAQTAASLEATYGIVNQLGTSATALSDAALLAASADTAQAADATANDNVASLTAKLDELREEIAGMRSENNQGHAATAGNTGAIKRTLDNVTSENGGNSISTVIAA
ncbi:hypothetical protein HZY97_20165 [Sphingomonas sp. R-74633]|uniref:hypothetical protein n=1 Tax=Sphingomonas sp. R-74633 TaxID=2751188 RepID=UPI0015D11413|nr:hypothetical protein [Sphingomonas sp. R-74633]NYT43101.1 hypothetical protein [Sphingomonas sp. R-74633]